jgi:hypothetical protein
MCEFVRIQPLEEGPHEFAIQVAAKGLKTLLHTKKLKEKNETKTNVKMLGCY